MVNRRDQARAVERSEKAAADRVADLIVKSGRIRWPRERRRLKAAADSNSHCFLYQLSCGKHMHAELKGISHAELDEPANQILFEFSMIGLINSLNKNHVIGF